MTVAADEPSRATAIDELDLDRLDPSRMLATVEDSPKQWADALALARHAPAPEVDPSRTRAVIVAGMGGSGIAANVAAVAARYSGRVPVIAAKDYGLVALAGRETLVVVVSYSGDTEESLACLEAASAAGAPTFAVGSGGRLAERAEREGFPLVRIPGGGQPRANLPYLVVPVLVALERAGLVSEVEAQLEEVPDHLASLMRDWHHERPPAENLVKRLAIDLKDLVPVFYGASGWPSVAAQRAKCQTNENAKRPAFWNELPELDHNEVVGWYSLGDICRHFAVVEVRSRGDEDPRVARRFEVTREVIEGRVGLIRAVEVSGPNPIARFAAAVLFFDLLSVYLAFLGGEDPTPVAAITAVKERLAGG
ncbi:MAG: bifunctional phosphoglucose/phosphomannose isomerase [Nitriliruptorales bacterium]